MREDQAKTLRKGSKKNKNGKTTKQQKFMCFFTFMFIYHNENYVLKIKLVIENNFLEKLLK